MSSTKEVGVDAKVRWILILAMCILLLSVIFVVPSAASPIEVVDDQTEDSDSDSDGGEPESESIENQSSPVDDVGNESATATSENQSETDTEVGALLPSFANIIYGVLILLVIISAMGIVGTHHYRNEQKSTNEDINEIINLLEENTDSKLAIHAKSSEILLDHVKNGRIVINKNTGGKRTKNPQEIIGDLCIDNTNTTIEQALNDLDAVLKGESPSHDIAVIRDKIELIAQKEREYQSISNIFEDYQINGTIPADPKWSQLYDDLENAGYKGSLIRPLSNLTRSLTEYQRELKNAQETKRRYRKKAKNYDDIENAIDVDWLNSQYQHKPTQNIIVKAIEDGNIGEQKIATVAKSINRPDPTGTNLLSILSTPNQYETEKISSTINKVLDDLTDLRVIKSEFNQVDNVSLADQLDKTNELKQEIESPDLIPAVDKYISRMSKEIRTIPKNNDMERYGYSKGISHVHKIISSIETTEVNSADLDTVMSRYNQEKKDLQSRQEEKTHQITSIGHKIANHFVDLADEITTRADTQATKGNDDVAISLYNTARELLAAVRELYDDKSLRKHMRRL